MVGAGIVASFFICVAIVQAMADDARVERARAEQQAEEKKKQAPHVASPDDDATSTVENIRIGFPLICACDDFPWAACEDETKGYDAVLACAKNISDRCTAAKAKLYTLRSDTPCASEFDRGVSRHVTATEAFMSDTVEWLVKNKPALVGPLSREPLGTACDKIPGCNRGPGQLPSLTDDKYKEVMASAKVGDLECTKTLLQCGPLKDNVCWVPKVAYRLGVSCDSQGIPNEHSLYVRATGRRLQ